MRKAKREEGFQEKEEKFTNKRERNGKEEERSKKGWKGGRCCCLTSQQHESVSQGRICSDNFTCCHTQIKVSDPTFHLTQSQYTDTGPTSPGTDPIKPSAGQGSHWSAKF